MFLRTSMLVLLISLSGCASFFSPTQSGSSSSLLEFLYPNGAQSKTDHQVAVNVQLPLRVGLAFVPPNRHSGTLSASDRQHLLEKVADHFRDRPFIEHIEIIPQQYLYQRGFDTLRQLDRLHGLDAMALVSHDQMIAQEDKKLSLFYWTIVGAYVVPGTNNRVNTFVDTTVFDLSSGQLLFRAPGTDHIDARSTAVDSSSTSRRLSQASFARAMANMTTQLYAELDTFVDRVKGGQANVAVSFRPGYGGSGSLTMIPLLLILVIGIVLARRRV